MVGGKEKPDIWMTVMMRRKTVPSFLVCLVVVVVVLSFVCKLGVSNTAPEGRRPEGEADAGLFNFPRG